jgi:hypothetical protein
MTLTFADRRALTDPDREKIMGEVRQALWDYGDNATLSDWTGISVSCLNALRGGRTRWPRPETLLILLPYLGLELRLVRTNAPIYPGR